MLHAFLTYINEQKLFEPTDKILLTVSGGKDSITLFNLFCRANRSDGRFQFAVAHCNFQLRGEDSVGDEKFIEDLCKKQGITFHTTKFETKQFVKKNKVSTQMAARTLRYAWFEQIRQEFNYTYIATAHHLNDSIETVLLNLTKGTGISGLRGILPKNGFIIRPLLFASREQIDSYLAENQLVWREDSSNASDDYQRNLLRHQVVPILKKINPNFDETFARNLERMQAVEADFRRNLNAFKTDVLREENGVFFLSISQIKTYQSAAYFLEELLKDFGFNYFQSKEIYHSLDGLSGKIFHSSTHTILKDREELIITDTTSPPQPSPIGREQEQKLPIAGGWEGIYTVKFEGKNLKFSLIDMADFDANFTKNSMVLFVDYEKIVFPLMLRKWQEGDWFIPFGMKGKKKISDFLIDKKISMNLKKNIFLLTSEDKICWVVGYRADDRFRITTNTKRVLKIEII
ncbi:tRNA lysidine(34) synthetase TilS [Emticicia sp. SJ17W-69]|uniref:tRNA lysidine(34) synthetase TilS n=1 Tax=Emticicia sp. SJ17W-69 TaxID=3421657 RepID=UPI003EB868CC